MKKIKVRYRKLGREKAYGLALGHTVSGEWVPSREIELDPRQNSRELMDTVAHEVIHTENPNMTEAEVKRQARVLASVFWKLGFRKVETR